MSQTQIQQHLPKRTLFYKAGLLMIFILGLSSIFSPIRALSFFNEIWAICVISWFFFTFLENPYYLLIPNKHRIAIYVYLIYTIGIAYIAGNGSIGNRFFELSQIPLFYMAYQKNKLAGRNSDNLLILKLLVPFVILTSFITINAYRINPYISRSIKTSRGLGLDYSRMGVGGYEFIYFLVIVVPILLFVIFNKDRPIGKMNKFVGLIIIIVFSLNIVMSNYSTALLLLILGVIMRIFLKRISYLRAFFLSLLFILFISFIEPIILLLMGGLIQVLGDNKNVSRILELKELLLVGDEGISISARSDAFHNSIQVFLENPAFGIITNPIKSNIYGEIVGFGQHSQVLDTLAIFGVFIGVLQLYIYLQPIFIRLKQSKGIINGFSLTIFLIFVILISINNATPSIGFAVFFIYPTLFDWLKEKNIKKY
jgi:hypothetical protein